VRCVIYFSSSSNTNPPPHTHTRTHRSPSDGLPTFLTGISQQAGADPNHTNIIANLGLSLTNVQLLPIQLLGENSSDQPLDTQALQWKILQPLAAAAAAGQNVDMFLSHGRPPSNNSPAHRTFPAWVRCAFFDGKSTLEE
jgi:hypothetical protein